MCHTAQSKRNAIAVRFNLNIIAGFSEILLAEFLSAAAFCAISTYVLSQIYEMNRERWNAKMIGRKKCARLNGLGNSFKLKANTAKCWKWPEGERQRRRTAKKERTRGELTYEHMLLDAFKCSGGGTTNNNIVCSMKRAAKKLGAENHFYRYIFVLLFFNVHLN